MRRHVKPAHPEASIPDPQRGRDLPPDGYPVEWNAHWAGLAFRDDIIVEDLPSETDATVSGTADADPRAGEPGPIASMPFVITKASRARLRALGKTDDEIAQMTPAAAQALLAEPDPAA